MFKSILLSLFFGAIAVFSYAPFHFWPLAFVSFTGLLWLICHRTRKQAMLLAFLWGTSYFLAGTHWVYVSIKQYGNLPTPLAITILMLLIAYLSLYPMLFALTLRAVHKFAPKGSFKQLVIAAPLIWQSTEFLRGYLLNGFAWLQLGNSQIDSPLRAYFPIIGINGVNLLTTILSGLLLYTLYAFVRRLAKKQRFIAAFALLLIFFAPLCLSGGNWVQVDTQRSAKFALIQGNIAQSLRWSRAQLNNTIDLYASLTKQQLKSSDIIIWSEASITDIEANQQPLLHALDQQARTNKANIAIGILDYRMASDAQNDPRIYNSLLVLGDPKAYHYQEGNRYQKHHLVPFGEFTPFESLLKPIANLLDIPMSSMSAGDAVQAPLKMQNFKFTAAICYEVILSDLVWHNFHADTDFLLTVSNDAWFGNSIGPWQHLQMAQVRALEFGRPLIRSTNNGITAVIDHQGNIIKQLPQFEIGVLNQTLSPTTGLTPYARFGSIPYYLLLALMLFSLLIRKRKVS